MTRRGEWIRKERRDQNETRKGREGKRRREKGRGVILLICSFVLVLVEAPVLAVTSYIHS